MQSMTAQVLLIFFYSVVFVCVLSEGCKRFEILQVLERFYQKRANLPLTVNEAIETGWRYVGKQNTYHLDIYRFQEVNSFFIFFYKSKLAGVAPTYNADPPRLIMTKKRYEENKRNIGRIRAFIGKAWMGGENFWHEIKRSRKREVMFRKSIKIDGVRIRYGMIMFVDPNIMRRKQDDPCIENTLYIQGKTFSWRKVPYLEKDIPEQLPKLIKQGCFDRRGFYYFYNMKRETDCNKLHGFFALYNPEGVLWGFGVMIFGETNFEEHTHPFPIYTYIPIPYMKEIMPHSECPKNRMKDGLTALHLVIQPGTQDFKCPIRKDQLL